MAICETCIHDEVCGLEGHLDEALTFCDNKATDVQPIRYGKWKYYKNNGIMYVFECTNCKQKILLHLEELNRDDEPQNYNFCPHCGADMREPIKG